MSFSRLTPLRLSSVLAAFLLSRSAAFALVVFEAAGSTDNDFNTTAPSNGAPWSHVAQQNFGGAIDSSAVYLGNGYLLTANHTFGPTSVILDNVGGPGSSSYAIDPDFPAISFSPIDMRLYRILDPPALALLPLPDSTDDDTGTASTLIGWGKGKGAVVNGSGPLGQKGWQWGVESTKAKRWGTATTDSTTSTIGSGASSYTALKLTFGPTPAATDASAALADSGGAVFQKFGPTWKLAGVISAISSADGYPNGVSLYNPAGSRSSTFAVRMRDIAPQLRFRQWKQGSGIPEETPADDDSDGDGLGILEEYAYGLDKDTPSVEGAPEVGREGDFLTLTYQLERLRTDLTVAVMESEGLVAWNPATVAETVTVSDAGTIRTFKAKVPMGSATRKFLRLEITVLE